MHIQEFDNTSDYYDYLIEVVDAMNPTEQFKIGKRYRIFIRELALAHDAGYDPRHKMSDFIKRMRKAIDRKGRPWSTKDFDRYLDYCAKRGWVGIPENPDERLELPPIIAKSKELAYACKLSTGAKVKDAGKN